MNPPLPLDPFTLPLTGWQLIEASAGTGKTWTLEALYVRLVLGHHRATGQRAAPLAQLTAKELSPGLSPEQILVMTFTEAATAELRQRIRARLAQAAQLFQTGSADAADEFLSALRLRIDPAQWALCAKRLSAAAQAMDEAAIFTLHGWCSRMLRSHAFDSNCLFNQSRVEDSEQLKLRAVQDYWRRWYYRLDAAAVGALDTLAREPQELFDQLKTIWAQSERAPAAHATAAMPPDLALAAWSRWQHQSQSLEAGARAAWNSTIRQTLEQAAAARAFKGVALVNFGKWLDQMDRWAQGASIERKTLERFGQTALCAKGWSQASAWPIFHQLDLLHAQLASEPTLKATLLAHAAQEVGASYHQLKQQRAQFDFSDLLQNLYAALQAPDGRLARDIAAQHPVALVDEFQDTDPWQFGILSKIYANAGQADKPDSDETNSSQENSVARALIMIGDPKQAIYSFRGADLATYMQARERAHGIYTLTGNYRSNAAVVAAINRVFAHAVKPFGELAFTPALACNAQVPKLSVAGQVQPGMTVWHLAFDQPPNKARYLSAMAELFASEMVRLLNARACQPGEMAALVRDWREASALRQALAQRGVASVYLSERDSVFASGEALDLWRILGAIQRPSDSRAVRAALASKSWGLSWAQLDCLTSDEAAWDAQVEQFVQCQRIWQTQGLLPMLYHLLLEQGLAARLLQMPTPSERVLTNLLHLGELLQTAAQALQGTGALLRYLEHQLRHPKASGETAQLRLESDAQLVQVVTMHKAKGLQYPLVFLPFAANYRSASDERSDQARLSEDIRLFYVALTRSQQALWLGVSQVSGELSGKTPQVKSALSALLGRRSADDLWLRLQAWAGDDVALLAAAPANRESYHPAHSARASQAALRMQRLLPRDWWSASYSALARELSPADSATDVLPAETARPKQDDQALRTGADLGVTDFVFATQESAQATRPSAAKRANAPTPSFNAFPAGSRYGTLLHELLLWQARHGWPAARCIGTASVSPLDDPWESLLRQQCLRAGVAKESSIFLNSWISALATQRLPLVTPAQQNTTPTAASADGQLEALAPGFVLGALQASWPEMGFTLPVQKLSSTTLDGLISAEIWPHEARPMLSKCRMQGVLTGFIDLVLYQQGRYWVLDYKSNQLADYLPATLKQAMLAHRYDVQAVLYLLALHRLLKSRLPTYHYEQHVGGALYLFLRGIDQPGAGLRQISPSRDLIEQLDAAMQTPEDDAP